MNTGKKGCKVNGSLITGIAFFAFFMGACVSPCLAEQDRPIPLEKRTQDVFSVLRQDNKAAVVALKNFLNKFSAVTRQMSFKKSVASEEQLKMASTMFDAEIGNGQVTQKLTDSQRMTEFYDSNGKMIGSRKEQSDPVQGKASEEWFRVDQLQDKRESVLIARSTSSEDNQNASKILETAVEKGWTRLAAENQPENRIDFYVISRFYGPEQKLVGQCSSRADGQNRTWYKFNSSQQWEIIQ